MCRSAAEGGQRCAAHTRPRYEAAAFGTLDWDNAAAEYAATKEGRERLSAVASAATCGVERHAALMCALRRGDAIGQASAETAQLVLALWQPSPAV